ncbi:MAG: DUF433 domain-containing protein [Chloroflexota bacterium]|nr:DUF433 domain-containing protein [Chloroflexota bacterium]
MVAETKTEYPHIVRRTGAGGDTAVLAGTNIGVWFIVRQLRTGDTPEDIVTALPHVTLAGIYAAMSYYHDHRAEIDPIIEHGDRLAASHDAEPGSRTTADS